MSVSIQKINQRLYRLSYESPNPKLDLNGVRLVDESKNIFFENNAAQVINNWEGLDSDKLTAYNKALDVFDSIIENASNEISIQDVSSRLIEGINKVRDAKKLERSLKVRKSKLQKPAETIGKAIEKSTGANQASINNISNNSLNNSNKAASVKEAKISAGIKAYNDLIQECSDIVECDRIVKHYSLTHNRFNIDKLITESSMSTYEKIYKVAKCIDTFNSPFINRYNAALETCWYGFKKNHLEVDNKTIVEAVTDYFIFNGGFTEVELEQIKSIRSISPVFTEAELSIIDYLDNETPEETVSRDDINYADEFYGNDTMYNTTVADAIDSMEESALEKIIGIKTEIDPDTVKSNDNLHQDILEFKKACANNADSVMNLSILQSFVSKICEYPYKKIMYEFNSILAIIRTTFIADQYEHEIKEVIALVRQLFKAILDGMPSQNEIELFRSTIEMERDDIKTRVSNAEDKESRKRLSEYELVLSNGIADIDAYIQSISDKEEDNNEYKFEDPMDDEDPSDGLKEMAAIILISDLVKSISEDAIDKVDTPDEIPVGVVDDSINKIIIGNIEKYSNDTIDAVTDFSITVPDIVCKEKLAEALIDYRDSLRKTRSSSVDYIRIDVLNDNIRKLQEDTKVYNTYSDIKGCIAYLMCIDELKKVNLKNNDKYFTEAMSFVNTLKLAMNNLRRKAVNLSEKEKSASSRLDSTMNSIMKTMDRKMTAQERERVINGRVLPSASQCLKIALMFAAAWAIQPAIAIIGALGMLFTTRKATLKERQLAIDEIEVELKMVERYINYYENKGDLEAVRQCEICQRNLQRQLQRIKYRMKVDFGPQASAERLAPIKSR